MEKRLERIAGKELEAFTVFSLILLFMAAIAAGFAAGDFKGLAEGLWRIIISRDALITDYFKLAGYGAALLNAVFVSGISILLVMAGKIPFTGPTMAALFINAG